MNTEADIICRDKYWYCSPLNYYTEAEINGIKAQDFTGIFFGSGLCGAHPLMQTAEKLNKYFNIVKEIGLKVIFSIPLVHEREAIIIDNFLRIICQNCTVDEFSVNDIGTLVDLRNKYNWKGKISFGRLFERSMREARYSSEELYLDKCYRFEMSATYLRLADTYKVTGIVTDTIPNQTIDLSLLDNKFNIYLIYPFIFLSKSAYCEFSALNNDTIEKFKLGSHCRGLCKYYGKEIQGLNTIYREGLIAYCKQKLSLEECVTGNFIPVLGGKQVYESNRTDKEY